MKEFIIDKFNNGKKVFRYIQTLIPDFKNSDIFRIIRKGVVKVNNKIIDPDYVLKINDKINIFLDDKYFKKNKFYSKKENKFHSVKIDLNIIFENKDLLVVNKKAGILVHPNNKEYKNTLIEMAKAYLYKKGEYNPKSNFNLASCNRLDTNTSGIVVIAKNHKTLQYITKLFRDRETIKTYLTLVYGKISNPILITSKIDDRENEENKVTISDLKMMNIIPDKKEFFKNNKYLQATLVKPIKYDSQCSLCEVELWTGKKHQIRAHLYAVNHPILGDKKYFTKASLSLTQLFGLDNYLLHSYKLKIDNYNEWVAPVPVEFKNKVKDILKLDLDT